MQLILASTSPYRRDLLQRLQIPFEQVAPDFEEIEAGSLPPTELVLHNTLGKAEAVFARYPHSTVIASDQMAVCGDLILGKPGDTESACAQLAMLSGKTVQFLTGLALISPNQKRNVIVPFAVHFRALSKAEIEAYVEKENPIDCAGSFKSEGLGISLLERLEGDDPTALIGLPLIRLSQWLKPLAR
ncbi:Maf-like protein YceF [Mariprofundus micogutta]|uniref:7-methyl-GTP pyrophosphatase n=1 Tax=Mariprofundus micogutta TaxID=1921010 RepID=A0A1L8CKW5_9PROT|nr:Maf family protein [Mariprofundus micogutta]GAV19550.1 Maf-like protein YceF [Mariprofundus micogutta]